MHAGAMHSTTIEATSMARLKGISPACFMAESQWMTLSMLLNGNSTTKKLRSSSGALPGRPRAIAWDPRLFRSDTRRGVRGMRCGWNRRRLTTPAVSSKAAAARTRVSRVSFMRPAAP